MALLSAVLFLVSSCSRQIPESTQPPSTVPPSPTATLVFPTLIPTPSEGAPQTDLPPLEIETFGDPVYSTRFEQTGEWQVASDAFGAVSYLSGKLSIVVTQPGTSRYVPSPTLPMQDFQLDVTLGAVVCSGDDEYGVAFRHTPEGDGYRFTVTCQGGARLRRVQGGSSRAVVPFLESTAAARRGAPVSNRFVVTAAGQDLTLWLNGTQVFAVRDPSPAEGSLGLLVSSAQSSPQTTVQATSFSVFASPPARETPPTATESPNG